MKYKHSANLVVPFLILSALPASADPVLWNYTTRTVDFAVCELYRGVVPRNCEGRQFKRGEFTALKCNTSTCSVAVRPIGKIRYQKVYFRNGAGVTLDDYGLHVVPE
jgi:hypothetical protein